MSGIRCNPGWEELESWLNGIDMSGPTPGLFRVERNGALTPLHIDDLTVEADRDRLLDDARD